MKAYYDARAPEYDDWYYGQGQFAGRDRPGWNDELAALEAALRSLPPARTLDVACGTGYLTRWLAGDVTALDQSDAMVAEARARLPDAELVRADALDGLPFEDGAFERVFTGHFYGHLEPADRDRFLAEARRVARELVVVDSAGSGEEWQERMLDDGTRWRVYKRWFTADALLDELGGGSALHDGRWFVAVAS
ncbi:MAG TPA: methyltransferase domain-containing protein [Gaiellaceae bacterium]|jgi:demethylmenaquinone methyltransferase/2-methoxy-6-polyprenyl-1,4-benzoquinol methylase|nr:methyltransferase domain-containing protein [Gaiellaceae bacterium]